MPLIKHILQDVAVFLIVSLAVLAFMAGMVWLRVAGLNLMCEWHWLVWCRP